MSVINSVMKIFKDESYRIFAIAIIISFFWHAFWLSTVSIVSKPDSVSAIKFSKVSFLGPFLGKGAMDLRARPKERSLLEKRYLEAFDKLSQYPIADISTAIAQFEPDKGAYRSRDEGMIILIDESLTDEKPELAYGEE